MTPENVQGFRRSIDELGMKVSSNTASVAPMVPGMNADQTFIRHGNTLLIVSFYAL